MESVDTRQKRPFERLAERRGRLLDLLERFGATNIQVFASVARVEDTVDSDLDILPDFPPEAGLLKSAHPLQAWVLLQLRTELHLKLGWPPPGR